MLYWIFDFGVWWLRSWLCWVLTPRILTGCMCVPPPWFERSTSARVWVWVTWQSKECPGKVKMIGGDIVVTCGHFLLSFVVSWMFPDGPFKISCLWGGCSHALEWSEYIIHDGNSPKVLRSKCAANQVHGIVRKSRPTQSTQMHVLYSLWYHTREVVFRCVCVWSELQIANALHFCCVDCEDSMIFFPLEGSNKLMDSVTEQLLTSAASAGAFRKVYGSQKRRGTCTNVFVWTLRGWERVHGWRLVKSWYIKIHFRVVYIIYYKSVWRKNIWSVFCVLCGVLKALLVQVQGESTASKEAVGSFHHRTKILFQPHIYISSTSPFTSIC